MNLKPCPNPECDRTGNLHRIIDAEACWVECTSCGLVGPTGKTEEKGDYLWNLMPRKDDDKKSKYAMRIRVNVFETRKFADEERKLYIKGWIIGFGMSRNETYPIIEYDTGEILLLSFDLIEVDNGNEA